MKTLRALFPFALLLSLAACPPVEPEFYSVDVSDRQNDPRADLPGLGGPDPGAGLPDLYAESCRVLESHVLGRDALETLELVDDAEGRPKSQRRAFNDDETGRATYAYDAQGRLTQIEATNHDLKTTTRFTWDNDGRLTGATVTDPFGDVTTFVYAWAGDRLLSMAAEARYGDVSPVSRWGARYAYAEDGRLVKKTLLSNDNIALTVGYDYDKNGHVVVKRFKEPDRNALPVADAYTWEGDRLTRVERAVKGHITRYTYDTADRLVGVESVVVDGDRERIESVIELETTCDADTESEE